MNDVLEEPLYLATIAVEKNYDYETMKYSDYLYGKEDLIHEVWDYVEELKEIGRKEFYKKYCGSCG